MKAQNRQRQNKCAKSTVEIMDLLPPREKINKLRMETEQIGNAMKILLELKKEIISKVEETKNTIRNFCTQKSAQTTRPSIVVKDRTVSLLDR